MGEDGLVEELAAYRAVGAPCWERALELPPPRLVVTRGWLASGLERPAVSELRRRAPEFRSLVVLDDPREEGPCRAIRQQEWGYLTRPFGPEELVLSVEGLLEADRRHRKLRALSRVLARGVKQRLAPELRSLREAAFRAFFVEVQAERLGPSEAFHLWELLEELEADVFRSPDTECLASGWQHVGDVVSSLACRGGFRVLELPVPEHFQALFEGVRGGRVHSHVALMLAPMVRSLSPEALAANPTFGALHALLWG